MIPKLIHANWFGERSPSNFLLACRRSVTDVHPDWEVRPFSDALFDDLRRIDPTLPAAAYYAGLRQFGQRTGVWVWLSDFVRLLQLYAYGGFWIDWDMYAVRPLDRFLAESFVVGEAAPYVPAEALLGAEPRSAIIRDLIRYMLTTYPEPQLSGATMNLGGYVVANGIKAYPPDYFVPHARKESGEAQYRYTANTYLIHCWNQNRYDLRRLQAIADDCC
jgi:mannosyltransferase OCH1-like enzyme